MSHMELSSDQSTVTISLPLAIRRRGGRKVVVAPEGLGTWAPPRRRVDSSLVKAIARAYRWQTMLEEGTYATTRDLSAAEKISPTYISRLLRLTLLAPEIVEGILDGRHPRELTTPRLFRPFPVEWEGQGKHLVCPRDPQWAAAPVWVGPR